MTNEERVDRLNNDEVLTLTASEYKSLSGYMEDNDIDLEAYQVSRSRYAEGGEWFSEVWLA